MRRQRQILVPFIALLLGASACTSTEAANESIDLGSDEVVLTGGLRRVDSCDSLLNEFKKIGAEHVGPYGFGDGWYGGPMPMEMTDVAMEEGAPAETTSSDSAAGGEGSSFSGTNNQEANVDEADLVKTDGSRLVVVTGNKVRVFAVTGDSPQLTTTITLPDNAYGGEIFLSGDRAYLMTTGWSQSPLLDTLSVPGFAGTNTARLLELNLVEGTVGRAVDIDGQYVSSRQVGDTIRIVLSATSQNFPFVYPSNPGAEESAKKANQDLLAESSIEMWLPSYRLSDGESTIADGMLVPCNRMYLPTEFSGFGTVSVLTIDTNEGLTPQSIGSETSLGVMSSGETVYSSTNRMAIATARWPQFDGNGEPEVVDDYTTAIHTFDISNPDTTEYVASGSVDGHLLSQYAMSEFDGYLRVATTEGALWWTNESSESSVVILQENGNELKTVGEVGGLGKGEQIFAVRFMDDRAYVVTFRQTDPLYVIDLSDPTNPVTKGELKIPGFSAYLHPLPDNRLLGIGQDGTEDGRTTGAAISLFDVSDPANPTRIQVQNLGENSYSAVDWDAKAFTWWEPSATGFVPISWWNYDEASGGEDNGSAAVAVHIGSEGIEELGRISHPKVSQCEGPDGMVPAPEPLESDDAEAALIETQPVAEGEPYCWSYQAEIRRTIVIDNKVYTVSDAGLKVNALDGLAELSWTAFS